MPKSFLKKKIFKDLFDIYKNTIDKAIDAGYKKIEVPHKMQLSQDDDELLFEQLQIHYWNQRDDPVFLSIEDDRHISIYYVTKPDDDILLKCKNDTYLSNIQEGYMNCLKAMMDELHSPTIDTINGERTLETCDFDLIVGWKFFPIGSCLWAYSYYDIRKQLNEHTKGVWKLVMRPSIADRGYKWKLVSKLPTRMFQHLSQLSA